MVISDFSEWEDPMYGGKRPFKPTSDYEEYREYHWNSPNKLPLVGPWFLIEDTNGELIKVKRESYLVSKGSVIEYTDERGVRYVGRFKWCYI